MKNILGVLGGMGPQATVRFYDLAIEKSRAMGACKNCDFPHMVISNAPVPDFISGRKDEEVAVGMIEQEIVRLENAGADFLVITCNTMHLHMERFRAKGSVPILSMIDAVVDKIKADQKKCVGVLGSPTTMNSKLYSGPLSMAGLKVLVPSQPDQDILEMIIRQVIAGKNLPEFHESIFEIAFDLVDKGADAIVLGCTELPLVASEAIQELKEAVWYDSLKILVSVAIEMVFSHLRGNNENSPD